MWRVVQGDLDPYSGTGTLLLVSGVARRAQALMDQIRRRLVKLAEMSPAELAEMGAGLNAELGSLADMVARAQGLTSAEDPLGGTYRQEIANLRNWLRAQDESPDCPVAPELVAAWLKELARDRAAVTMGRYVAGIRAWHRAEGHADPTESDEVREVIAGLDTD
ncbi:hypothetical protein ENSA7_64970 [Enhygromyxa salina]|uniref:Integrase n=2 Tax=Enhygromyxa salina TaxID=215803 RepID=A0A2S9Y0C0_9BACT|nr:hypothetical protein ENSA7_64970 [Enhygromyxa salina]